MKMEKKMSEEANIEVEVTDEVTPQDAVRNMMDKWADGDYTAANDEFEASHEVSAAYPGIDSMIVAVSGETTMKLAPPLRVF